MNTLNVLDIKKKKSFFIENTGLPWRLSRKESTCDQEPQEPWVWSPGQEDPLEGETATCPRIHALKNSHGQRSLVGYSPWGRKGQTKYWSFSFSISPSNEYSGLISSRIDLLDLLAVQGLSRIFSSTTTGRPQFFGTQPC